MLWGIGFIIIIIIFLLILLLVLYYFPKVKFEPFISINDSNLYMPVKDKLEPTTIKYQVPIANNQLTDLQLQGLDTDVLRKVRVLKNFSNTDELDFYQMYNLLKQFKNKPLEFTFNPNDIKKKSHILKSEKLIELNTGAINKANLELFYRLKFLIRSNE